MAIGGGVTEIPDSDEEPFSSSPGAAGDGCADAQRGPTAACQASTQDTSHTAHESLDALHAKTCPTVEQSDLFEPANPSTNAPLQKDSQELDSCIAQVPTQPAGEGTAHTIDNDTQQIASFDVEPPHENLSIDACPSLDPLSAETTSQTTGIDGRLLQGRAQESLSQTPCILQLAWPLAPEQCADSRLADAPTTASTGSASRDPYSKGQTHHEGSTVPPDIRSSTSQESEISLPGAARVMTAVEPTLPAQPSNLSDMSSFYLESQSQQAFPPTADQTMPETDQSDNITMDISASMPAHQNRPASLVTTEPQDSAHTPSSLDVANMKSNDHTAPKNATNPPNHACVSEQDFQAPLPATTPTPPNPLPKHSVPTKPPQESTLATLKAQRASLLASLVALPQIQALIAPNKAPDHRTLPPATNSPPDANHTDAQVTAAANKLVKSHIKLLHEYNEIKDVGQGLMGLIADQRGVRIVEVQEEFGLDAKD